jgi:hypothetical protein
MPLSLEAQNILRALSEPIDQRRRSDFLQEATRRLEAAPIVGPGTAHQVGRLVQRDFSIPLRTSARTGLDLEGLEASLGPKLGPKQLRTGR